MIKPSPEEAPVSALLLHRSAEILLDCVQSVLRIEERVIPLVPPGLAGTERLALQEMDLLQQRLNDIAGCLTRIAECQLRHETIVASEILFSIRLDDLKDHLMGNVPGPRNPQEDCILF